MIGEDKRREYNEWLRTPIRDPGATVSLEPCFADGESVSIFAMEPGQFHRAYQMVAAACLLAIGGRYWVRRLESRRYLANKKERRVLRQMEANAKFLKRHGAVMVGCSFARWPGR